MQTTMSHGRGAAEEMDKKHGENKAVETLFSAAQLLNVAMLSSSRAEQKKEPTRRKRYTYPFHFSKYA